MSGFTELEKVTVEKTTTSDVNYDLDGDTFLGAQVTANMFLLSMAEAVTYLGNGRKSLSSFFHLSLVIIEE